LLGKSFIPLVDTCAIRQGLTLDHRDGPGASILSGIKIVPDRCGDNMERPGLSQAEFIDGLQHGQSPDLTAPAQVDTRQHCLPFCQDLTDSQLQGRNDLSLKPGVALEPQLIAWRGMNEGEIAWPQLAPVTHLVAEVRVFCSHLLIQITALCILTNQQYQLDMGQVVKQAWMPTRRTFRPWRQVAGFALAG